MRGAGFAIFLIATAVCRGQGIITTIAGTDITYPGTSFPALSASFGLLGGVAVSPSGGVYFTSQTRSLILRFDPNASAGVNQINITIPANAPTGDAVPLQVMSADGRVLSTPGATIAIQ